jgi:adenine/guanine phosphoribosyltransferase-like PRPP-binding protein
MSQMKGSVMEEQTTQGQMTSRIVDTELMAVQERMKIAQPFRQLVRPIPMNITVRIPDFTDLVGRSYTFKFTEQSDVDAEKPEPEPEPELTLGTITYDSRHYSDPMFTDPTRLVKEFKEALATGRVPEYDTIIGTGLSGSIAAGIIAASLNVMYAVVRKEGVQSHSDAQVEGCIGARWLFIDDFIGSGATFRRVRKHVSGVAPGAKFVGSWLYGKAILQDEYGYRVDLQS